MKFGTISSTCLTMSSLKRHSLVTHWPKFLNHATTGKIKAHCFKEKLTLAATISSKLNAARLSKVKQERLSESLTLAQFEQSKNLNLTTHTTPRRALSCSTDSNSQYHSSARRSPWHANPSNNGQPTQKTRATRHQPAKAAQENGEDSRFDPDCYLNQPSRKNPVGGDGSGRRANLWRIYTAGACGGEIGSVYYPKSSDAFFRKSSFSFA